MAVIDTVIQYTNACSGYNMMKAMCAFMHFIFGRKYNSSNNNSEVSGKNNCNHTTFFIQPLRSSNRYVGMQNPVWGIQHHYQEVLDPTTGHFYSGIGWINQLSWSSERRFYLASLILAEHLHPLSQGKILERSHACLFVCHRDLQSHHFIIKLLTVLVINRSEAPEYVLEEILKDKNND